MSCYLIYYENGAKMMRPITSPDEYRALRGSQRQQLLVNACRKGDNDAKRKLLQMNYSCLAPSAEAKGYPLKGNKLPSGSVGMDIDFDPADPNYEARMQGVPQLVLAKKDELGLLMLERSVKKGYHMVFRRRFSDGLAEGRVLENQERNLRWASDLLGVQYDEGAKDITRVFFTTTASADDLLYLSPALFERGEPEADASGTEATNAGEVVIEEVEAETVDTQPTGGMIVLAGTPPAGSMTPPANPSARSTPPTGSTPASPLPDLPTTYDGVDYALIVEALAEQLGGVPAHGSRNQFIFTMACNLRYICNDDPAWIARVLPTYGEATERWMSTIRSACSRSQNKKMPNVLLRALGVARANSAVREGNGDGEAQTFWGTEPPAMPKRLPPLIKLLVSKTPKVYQPAVAHAVFPSLATHLWKTRFRYIDNEEHEATLMNVLMAGTGAGKNCIAAPINCIMKDIRERDQISLEKERQWKEETQTKGANKDKRKRPEGIVVQEVDADMTNAAFVLRLSEADEHFLYARMNEIDQFDALKTTARSKSQFQIMCLAFDPGNQYGQTRVGVQSVSARVCVRFNWNASTTIQKGKQYFKSVLTDGPISRINFCTIPEQPIGAPIPVYGMYDADFEAELKPYIDRLNNARGLIECPQATRLAHRLLAENVEFLELTESRTYENLSHRANVIAFLKAMVLYVAHGERWDKTMEEFVRWSERYDMWCKMEFFGEAIREAENPVKTGKRGPTNMLTMLRDRFTLEDAKTVRARNELDTSNTMHMLRNWLNRGYIVEAKDGQKDTWEKVRES